MKVALKPRQLLVLKLLCRGYENRHIAAAGHMSESNVERIRKQLMVNTRSSNAVQLGVFAERHGLLKSEPGPGATPQSGLITRNGPAAAAEGAGL
jgi:two-component system, NarL family, response regulator LiaR